MHFRPTRPTLVVGLCLVGVAGLVSRSFGQQQADPKFKTASAADTTATATAGTRPAPKPISIGSIDIDRVLKEYAKYKVEGENLRAEALARHNSLMNIATEAKQQQEMHAKMVAGSQDAQRIEAKMTQLKAQFEAGRENAEREFTQKEAETMATIFNEISAMTKGVAKSHMMTFVMRYSDTQASGTEPNSVMAAMSRTVLYADPTVDITADVIYWLNQRYKESGGPAPKPTSTVLPPGPAAQPRNAAPAGRAPATNPGRN
jgi:Skp family chaperone for outer membrane proteins